LPVPVNHAAGEVPFDGADADYRPQRRAAHPFFDAGGVPSAL